MLSFSILSQTKHEMAMIDRMEIKLPTKFVNQPSNSLYCPICQNLFQDPIISTGCGHTFCQKCIEAMLRTRPVVTCPIDDVAVNNNSVVLNRAVKGQLEDLLIYCQHGLYRVDSDDEFQIDEDGCKEHIPLGRRLEHEDNCLSAWVPCSNSSNHCGKFRKHNFENHMLVCTHHPCKNIDKGNFPHTVHRKLPMFYIT